MSGSVEIKFDFNNPDARESLKTLLKSSEYISNLDEIYRISRSFLKHGDTSNLTADQINVIEQIKSLACIAIE